MVLSFSGVIKSNTSLAKTRSHTILMTKKKTASFAKRGKVKSVKVSCSNKKVRITINKKRRTYTVHAKRPGKVTATISYRFKKGNTHTLDLSITVRSFKYHGKKAFNIQNRYRRNKGLSELTWSETAYNFARYRLRHSGMDSHRNLTRDAKNYFGSFYNKKHLLIGENLIWSSVTIYSKKAMKLWKGSSRHYHNIMNGNYKCGAIAMNKHTWCAIFFMNSADQVDSFKK